MKITYLGPSMATFSADAYVKLAALFGAPSICNCEEVLAGKNEEVLPLVVNHGGFGAIAMGTRAGGRVDAPLNSFIQLLGLTEDCPITVLGAIRMPINFALMARLGVLLEDIKAVVAHPKSFAPCRKKIEAMGVQMIESDSNGKAAYDVANNPDFARSAALGPCSAALRFGLQVLVSACEEGQAVTTFFLVGPKTHPMPDLHGENRALLVFRVNHEPGSLVRVLSLFEKFKLNMRQIHSYYTSEDKYDFAVEVECSDGQAEDCVDAVRIASKHMVRHILFGPFPIV